MTCPNCNAPVTAEEVQQGTCKYCGATLDRTPALAAAKVSPDVLQLMLDVSAAQVSPEAIERRAAEDAEILRRKRINKWLGRLFLVVMISSPVWGSFFDKAIRGCGRTTTTAQLLSYDDAYGGGADYHGMVVHLRVAPQKGAPFYVAVELGRQEDAVRRKVKQCARGCELKVEYDPKTRSDVWIIP